MNEQRNPDVVIVGGGAAGSSAALVLGRARADVTLIDAGRPSNSPSTGIGGLLGNDGTEPADFYRRASEELAAYPTITRRRATVEAIHSEGTPRWRLELGDGDPVLTDRLLLATGMAYTLTSIDGLEERWGAVCSIARSVTGGSTGTSRWECWRPCREGAPPPPLDQRPDPDHPWDRPHR